MAIAKEWGEGRMGSCYLMGVSVQEMKTFLGMNDADCYTTMQMYLMSLHFKLVKMIHFVMYILPEF